MVNLITRKSGVNLALVLIIYFLPTQAVNVVTFSPSSLNFQIGQSENVSIQFSTPLSEETTFFFTYQFGNDPEQFMQEKNVIEPLENLTLPENSTGATFTIVGNMGGSVVVGLNTSSTEFQDLTLSFIRIQVVHSIALNYIIAIIGWVYFLAWSVSFYPQVVLNFRRKSVVGLNFDFLAFNITGFIFYACFNIGMYWIPEIMKLYIDEHPRGVNPVLLNDVIFALHAVTITTVTIVQCFIYERGSQKISRLSGGIIVLLWIAALVLIIIAAENIMTWLSYLRYLSYFKLFITLVKYSPQAYMNYKRQSTLGWSIGNILLDFTGGSLSLLQMFLLAYNNDDWRSVFGNVTKFGLGILSILFDVVFIVQHYFLYRHNPEYEPIEPIEEIVKEDAENPAPCN